MHAGYRISMLLLRAFTVLELFSLEVLTHVLSNYLRLLWLFCLDAFLKGLFDLFKCAHQFLLKSWLSNNLVQLRSSNLWRLFRWNGYERGIIFNCMKLICCPISKASNCFGKGGSRHNSDEWQQRGLSSRILTRVVLLTGNSHDDRMGIFGQILNCRKLWLIIISRVLSYPEAGHSLDKVEVEADSAINIVRWLDKYLQ